MKLVEIVQGEFTGADVADQLMKVCIQMNKTPVLCKDAPGFIVNRVARHYYLEAMKLVEKNIASFEDIDRIMEASGFKMGPFKLMDLIGMDINLAVSKSLHEAFNNEPRFEPSPIQIEKVLKGELGKKPGKAFIYIIQAKTNMNTESTNEKILVTGGGGLLGNELIMQLLAEGKNIIALYNKTPLTISSPGLEIVPCSILDVVGLEEAMKGVTELYHCAGKVSFAPSDVEQLYKINVEGTANIVNAALAAGVKKMVHVSSVAALGRIRKMS